MSLVLVVDDSRSDRTLVAAFLEECGVHVVFADDGGDALSVIDRQHPDLVLTDMQMPRMNGLDLVRLLRVQHPAVVSLVAVFPSREFEFPAEVLAAMGGVPEGEGAPPEGEAPPAGTMVPISRLSVSV